MDEQAIMTGLEKVFGEVFRDSAIQLKPDTIVSDVEGWDSFSHIRLVLAVERSFKIRFTTQEIQSWANVGDLCKTILTKTR